MPLLPGKLPFRRNHSAIRSGAAERSACERGLREKYAEKSSTHPNTVAIAWVETRVATAAPRSAPRVVAISRNMPMRMFENPSLTYAAAAPDEVAITDTSDAPTA